MHDNMGFSDADFACHFRQLVADRRRKNDLGSGSASGSTGGAAFGDATNKASVVGGGSVVSVTKDSSATGSRASATSPAEQLTKDAQVDCRKVK